MIFGSTEIVYTCFNFPFFHSRIFNFLWNKKGELILEWNAWKGVLKWHCYHSNNNGVTFVNIAQQTWYDFCSWTKTLFTFKTLNQLFAELQRLHGAAWEFILNATVALSTHLHAGLESSTRTVWNNNESSHVHARSCGNYVLMLARSKSRGGRFYPASTNSDSIQHIAGVLTCHDMQWNCTKSTYFYILITTNLFDDVDC